MLKNYFTIAWRNLLKNRVFSIVNIAGLATGLACFILITLYVVDELSYDRFNEKADRIYRINSDIRFGGTELSLAVSSDALGAALKNDYPQVEEFARLYNSSGSKLVKKGNEFIRENNVVHGDSTLFNVFTLPAVTGNAKTALNDPNTVVITESTAKKYFGSTDVVGKTIETNDNGSTLYKVTAVIKDIPHNSHFNFDFIFSMDNVQYGWGNFVSQNFQTYLLLKPGTDYHEFEKNFVQVINKYVLPQAKAYMQINSMEEFEKAGNKMQFSLTPLTDIHLHSARAVELGVNGNIQYIYIFSAVALFILVLACINFMNLSTARSANRAREVGIRKVLGTEKRSLISQFLSESILTALIAMVLALGITLLILPFFNELAGKEISAFNLSHGKFLLFLLALPFLVGIMAGIYPAFFLSAFKPIAVLKGPANMLLKRSHLRSGLVVFQFFISIVLIIGTIVVFRQLNYIQTKKLGFSKDQLLIINGTGALGNNVTAFRNEISKMNGVKMSSYAGYLPVNGSSRSDNTFSKEAVMDSKSGFNMQVWNVDYDYINNLGMEITRGRNFSANYGTDSTAAIINETTAQVLGYDDPIGKKIYTNDGGNPPQTIAYTVIGVVKNFHFESMRQQISPLCMRLGQNNWVTAFKVNTADIRNLLSGIEKKWKAMAPSVPFSYQFLDDAFDDMYRTEQRVGKVALSFAVLAILIACLGLFGLATYMAEQRTKEIGVRKVLGATVTNIVSMLSKDFAKLVAIGAVIAFPVAWLMMNRWLQDFAYRVNIGWWIFLLAAFITLLIAFCTVVVQAVKAAVANPVKSLRTE